METVCESHAIIKAMWCLNKQMCLPLFDQPDTEFFVVGTHRTTDGTTTRKWNSCQSQAQRRLQSDLHVVPRSYHIRLRMSVATTHGTNSRMSCRT